MRLAISTIPWMLAVVGLAVPLVVGGFAGWPYAVGWAIAVGAFALARHRSDMVREFGRPALLLPVLFVLGLVGGWYLIPADIAWWLIETRDRRTGASPIGQPAGTP
jgi:hypothetical protein